MKIYAATLFLSLSLFILANVLAQDDNNDECPYTREKAKAAGQDCSIAKGCVSTSESCHGRRVCACDGYCGRRCIKIRKDNYCSELQLPHNALRLEYDSRRRRAFNTTVTYTCLPSTVVVTGNGTRKCRGDGQWSGQEPTCAIIPRASGCPQLSVPTGVIASGGEGNSFGTTQLFLCPHGWQTEAGESLVTSTCQVNGSWSRNPPICSVRSNEPDEVEPTTEPCVLKSCAIWESCRSIAGQPTCFCKHPSQCIDVSSNKEVCGSDGTTYESLCHLKSMAYFFGRDVDLVMETACPDEYEGIDYSLHSLSSDDISSVQLSDVEATTIIEGGDNDMFVTDEMIPDTTKRMMSAEIVMFTQTSPKMSTGRKTTPNRESTPNRITNKITTQEPTELFTTSPMDRMTTAPSVNIDGPVFMSGSEFYSYHNGVTEPKKAQMTNMIEITFKTRDYEGMLLYNGIGPKPKMGDFLFIAVYKGEAVLGFNLGQGFKLIESMVFVSDDKWHTVQVTRTQRDATLQVDQETPQTGSGKSGASQLNTDGVLWLGGITPEDYPDNVYPNYRNTFEGCVKDVKLDETSLHLVLNAIDVQPTEFCTERNTLPDLIATTLIPCLENTCDIWETCVSVNSEPTCFCSHPSECPGEDMICGTDGKNYTSVCHLKSTACFFGRDVDVATNSPCPKDPDEAADYSMYSLMSVEDDTNYSLSIPSRM